MDFKLLNTYQEAPEQAFEALCSQLFEQWVYATYPTQVHYFTTVNGAGGDGGVEAYADLTTGETIGLQAKWFLTSLQTSQISQIRRSVETAWRIRPHLRRYIVCVPRNFLSRKNGPGGKATKDTEEQRIQVLAAELRVAYPSVSVEFWTEHHLRQRLQEPGNEGLIMFWFEKEALSPATLQLQFDVAKTGWLRERYSPDLHCQGIIQAAVEEVLFSPAHRASANNRVGQVEVEITSAIQLIELFTEQAVAPPELLEELTALSTNLQDYRTQLQQVAQALIIGSDSLTIPMLDEVELWPIREKIERGRFSNRVRSITPRLLEALEVAHRTHLPSYPTEVLAAQRAHNLIVLGRPGTGKTHGVARAVELRLKAGYPALIISARTAPAQSWKAILDHTLGGLAGWSDREIFAGLEATAAQTDVRRARAAVPGQLIHNEPTRVLICIDGVDEAPDPALWRLRVNELHTWLAECPRLRFVVTSRSYPPSNQNPCGLECDDLINRRFDLPGEGDVPLPELAAHYLDHYRIDYSSLPWLPEAFQDALSVRLFTQQRQGQDLATIAEPIAVGLSDLLNYKIEQIETEFAGSPQLAFSPELHLARKGLISLTKQLQAQPDLEHEAVCQRLVIDSNERINLGQATLMLKGYANHGLVVQWPRPAAGRLAPPVIHVAFAFQQPLIDYLLACEAIEHIVASNTKNVPAWLLQRADWNALNLTAVILLNDNRILVGENGYWVDDLDPARLEAIKYHALSTAAGEAISRYLPRAISQFKQGTRDRNLVLKSFILPNLYRTDVEIVLPLIHEVLCGFFTVFERDEFWAGPASHDQSHERNVGQILLQYHLHEYYPATSWPLLVAWSLATVNNTYREHARRELTHWGRANIRAFTELLDLVFFRGDQQMQEDLAAVMLGIMSLVTQPGTDAPILADWILNHVFSLAGTTQILNSVVRACARDAVELALVIGDCFETDAQAARPPYPTSAALLPLKLATKKDRIGTQGERFPIVHDLAWYVLNEAYDGFMELPGVGKNRRLVRGFNLLAEYEQQYSKRLGPDSFAMSAALAYIASLGYNRLTGPGTTDATHGLMSKTSTFEEKYTWLAVHHLQGYLADRLPYEAHSRLYQRVPNYRLFLAATNPAANSSGSSANAPTDWYVPVEISPDLPTGATIDLPERTKAWVNRKDEPDFHTWLTLPGFVPAGVAAEPVLRPWLPLYAQIHLPERSGSGTTTLELCCVWVTQKEWAAMQRSLSGDMSKLAARDRWSFNDVDHWQARLAGAAASVKDVVRGSHLDEEDSTVTLYASKGRQWVCHKTVTSVGERSVEHGEATYLIPSQLVRQHLGIVDTDKQRFITETGQSVACYQELNEEDYSASQTLLVADRQFFTAANALHKLQPFWLVSQFQKTTVEFTQQHRDTHVQSSRFWLVWEEGDQIQAQLYHDAWFSNA